MDQFFVKLNGIGAQLNPLAKNIERGFGQVKQVPHTFKLLTTWNMIVFFELYSLNFTYFFPRLSSMKES
jgi:hypothetical protein